MWLHWISAYFIDPENWIGQAYDSRFHGTWKASSWYKNPQVDDLLTRAANPSTSRPASSSTRRRPRQIVDDAVDVWIYNTVEQRAFRTRVQGEVFAPVGSIEARTIHLE
ncbi:MAG: hypothetical protein WDO24_28310 [Pseudomonadota bacterium]